MRKRDDTTAEAAPVEPRQVWLLGDNPVRLHWLQTAGRVARLQDQIFYLQVRVAL